MLIKSIFLMVSVVTVVLVQPAYSAVEGQSVSVCGRKDIATARTLSVTLNTQDLSATGMEGHAIQGGGGGGPCYTGGRGSKEWWTMQYRREGVQGMEDHAIQGEAL